MTTILRDPAVLWRRAVNRWRTTFQQGDMIILFITMVMLLMPALSLQAAAWPVEPVTVVPVLIISVLLGFILARSHYGEVMALLLSTFYAGIAILFVAAWNDEDDDFLRGSESFLSNEYEGVWRARNSEFNELYYDPDQTYEPWVYGLDASGNEFTEANPTAARLDPYDPTNVVDLTALQAYSTVALTSDGTRGDAKHDQICKSPNAFGFCLFSSQFEELRERIAHYYTWEDSNSNGVMDADDTHERIEVTDADELINFANWFQYHRSRELRAKGRLAEFMSSVGTGYMAVASVNNNPDSQVEMAELGSDPALGQRKRVMDAIFGTRGNAAGTPLQEALYLAGEYLECTGGTNLYGTTDCPRLDEEDDGQCQRGAIILVTDGFASVNGSTVTSTGTP